MDKVFGREEILGTIKKRVAGLTSGYRQNIALIGSPLTGKTILLRNVLADIESCDIVPIYTLLNATNLRQTINSVSIQILRNFLKSHSIETNNDFTYLLEKSQAFIPRTVAKIKSIIHNIERKKTNSAILEIFELTKVLFEETNKPAVFIIDEFHRLKDIGGENIFSDIGKKIITQKNTMYLIASSSVARAKDILAHGLSLLFGNFEVLEIKPYTTHTSNRFIQQYLNVQISDIHKKFLIDFTLGNPFYLDRLCHQLNIAARAQQENLISENTFITAFENLLFNKWGILNQQFRNLFTRDSTDRKDEPSIEILSAIIAGNNKSKTLAKYLNKSTKIVQQKLSRFYDRGIIAKNGDTLYITDKALTLWIELIYKIKSEIDYVNPELLRINFREAIAKIIDSFSSHLQKNVIDRIIELFNLFANESIIIERKKIILSHFKEIKPLQYNAKNFDALVLAKSVDMPWIIAIKKDVITPADVAEFISVCKTYGHPRSQRRIIITLNAIETNAKLKALQEKIITWQTQDLNTLLKLYKRPNIFV